MSQLTAHQRARLEAMRDSENQRRARSGLAAISLEQFEAQFRELHAGTFTFLDVDGAAPAGAAASTVKPTLDTGAFFAKLNEPYVRAISGLPPSTSAADAAVPLVDPTLSGEALSQAAFARVNGPYDRAIARAKSAPAEAST